MSEVGDLLWSAALLAKQQHRMDAQMALLEAFQKASPGAQREITSAVRSLGLGGAWPYIARRIATAMRIEGDPRAAKVDPSG